MNVATPSGPLLDGAGVLAHFPLGAADHVLEAALNLDDGDDDDDDDSGGGDDCMEEMVQADASAQAAAGPYYSSKVQNSAQLLLLLHDFGRSEDGILAELLKWPDGSPLDNMAAVRQLQRQRLRGPLPAVQGVLLHEEQRLRVQAGQTPSNCDDRGPAASLRDLEVGLTVGVWMRVMAWPIEDDTGAGGSALPLMRMTLAMPVQDDDDIGAGMPQEQSEQHHKEVTVHVCMHGQRRRLPQGRDVGMLALCWGHTGALEQEDPCGCVSSGPATAAVTNTIPLRGWVHVSLALKSGSAGSLTVHDVRLAELLHLSAAGRETSAASDKPNACRDGLGGFTLVVGGSIETGLAEMRLHRGALSRAEAKATALALHVLDPLGSRAIEFGANAGVAAAGQTEEVATAATDGDSHL